MTSDRPKAQPFYEKLFGWSMKPSPEYTEFSNQGQPIGGIMQLAKEWGNVPSHWNGYFLVASVDASAAKATQLGGSLKMPPSDIPNVGRFAIVADPQGATFSLFQPAPRH